MFASFEYTEKTAIFQEILLSRWPVGKTPFTFYCARHLIYSHTGNTHEDINWLFGVIRRDLRVINAVREWCRKFIGEKATESSEASELFKLTDLDAIWVDAIFFIIFLWNRDEPTAAKAVEVLDHTAVYWRSHRGVLAKCKLFSCLALQCAFHRRQCWINTNLASAFCSYPGSNKTFLIRR